MKRIGIIAVISLLIDQLVKLIVVSNMKVFDSVEVISNFFRITYLQNTGGAFSLFSTNTVFLICLTSVILFVFILFISKQKEFTKSDIWIYGMLIGGILGNFIDRVRLGYVVDFLILTLVVIIILFLMLPIFLLLYHV